MAPSSHATPRQPQRAQPPSRWGGGRLVELDVDECWSLIDSRSVGRLAWTRPNGPTVLPVNHATQEHEVWVRTTPYSLLARECPGTLLAFEVDEVDEFTRSGWSVVVVGVARLVQAGLRGEPTWPDVDAWPEGPRHQHLVITPREVTGRRLLPS